MPRSQTAIDAAFRDVLQTACTAQSIAQSCPNPPSLALRLAPTSTPLSFDIAALAGGLSLVIFVLVVITAVCCWKKQQSAKVFPEPTGGQHPAPLSLPTAPPADDIAKPAVHAPAGDDPAQC